MKTDYIEPTPMNLINPMYPNYETQPGYNTMVGPSSYENSNYMGYPDPRFYRPQNGYPYNNPSSLTTPYQTKEPSFD